MKKRLVSLLLTLALLVLPVVSAGAAQPAAADPTPVQTQTETAEAAQHQYSYIALGGFLWALWAVYKASLGEEFGEYTLIMYRYAKTYYKKVCLL